MAGTSFSMTVVNMPSFVKGCMDVPKVQLRYMRTELSRGVKRIRKRFIGTQLKGRPGINATGRLSKGGNIKAFVEGKTMKDLTATTGISRLLHVHEKGLTIKPKKGKLLVLREKGTGPRNQRDILAMVPSVTIPKRLHFEKQVRDEAPAMLVKVAEAGERATRVTLEKALLKIA